MTTTVDGVDLFDPHLFRDGPPHDVFDVLRRGAPVYWNVREGDPDGGFWALTRHADVIDVSRRPATFTSSQGFSAPREQNHNAAFAENIMYRDPPAHSHHRKPLNRSFTTKAMVDVEPLVRTIARQILAEVDRRDEFDWVPNVAAELPARVVAAVIGVPESDHGKLVEWASNIFGRDGSAESTARFNSAVQAIMAYAESFKAAKRGCPADDVMSLLLDAEIDGCQLSEVTLSMWFLTLAQAGFETTHTLIAQGIALLAERPDVRERLLAEPAISLRVVDEMLRFITPVNMMARTAMEDTEIAGQPIQAGQYVTMWYAAANRDPAVFTDPHDFVVDRPTSQHQAFGAAGSPHYCLGAQLARLEMKVLLDELAARGFPYDVTGPAVRMPGVFMNALTSLPVRRRGGSE